MKLKSARDAIEMLYGSPIGVISDCLRGFIKAEEGHTFLCADFSNIEGRVLAWLAGEEWKLKAFNDFDEGIGPDIYKLMAALIYYVEVSCVDKDQRFIGKVAELACGFQGGVGAFQNMAKNFGIEMVDARANEIKDLWRKNNPNIVSFWYDLEKSAYYAVLHPGETFRSVHGSIRFRVKGSFLFCMLPSGRVLSYPYPKIQRITTPWGQDKEAVTYMGVDSLSHKWERQKAYGGFWAENVTQAVSRDVLAEAILRLESWGFPVVMHVHDEIVCEVPNNSTTTTKHLMEKVMGEVPSWAKGLPIAVEGWKGKRYRK